MSVSNSSDLLDERVNSDVVRQGISSILYHYFTRKIRDTTDETILVTVI